MKKKILSYTLTLVMLLVSAVPTYAANVKTTNIMAIQDNTQKTSLEEIEKNNEMVRSSFRFNQSIAPDGVAEIRPIFTLEATGEVTFDVKTSSTGDRTYYLTKPKGRYELIIYNFSTETVNFSGTISY